MEQNSIKRRSQPKKILSVRERLAKWQADLARKQKTNFSPDRAQSQGPNQAILITHLSPIRSVKRPYYEVKICSTIVCSILLRRYSRRLTCFLTEQRMFCSGDHKPIIYYYFSYIRAFRYSGYLKILNNRNLMLLN